MISHSILVVEDEAKIATLIRDYLVRDGFEVSLLGDGGGVVSTLTHNPPALIILDVMLPGASGLTVCRAVRQLSAVPIILLTARVDEQDRLDGFRAGADDYVCKPFSPAELVARVRSVLRRTENTTSARTTDNKSPGGTDTGGTDTGGTGNQQTTSTASPVKPLITGKVMLDNQQMRCTIDGLDIKLTPVEFRMLSELISKPGTVFSRYQLMRAVYRDHRVVSDRTIDSHVSKLRRKLGRKPDGGEYIRSAYSVGYKLVL